MAALYPRLNEAYQKRVVDANLELIQEVISGEKKILGRQITVSPTGSGKTFMMASVIEMGLKFSEGPAFVWLTHNKQILAQTENEVLDALGTHITTAFSIEQGIQSFGGRVLLFNVQKGVSSKALNWLSQWTTRQQDGGRPIIFIVDEADEGMSGDNMARLRETLSPALELGFTASFKKKPGEYEFLRVGYQDVIDAGMLVRSIEYQASDEVNRLEMMRRAINQRIWLEQMAEHLKTGDRHFIPKMLIQAPARECEGVAMELRKELNLSPREFTRHVVVHTQNSRGLEEIEDMSEVRYIVGDLMVERGWNCPEAYVLLSTRDSISVAKGIQLLGRVIRLPKCRPFDERFSMFNSAYVYISGKHSIEESCRNFTDGIVVLPPPREVVQVEKRADLTLPTILTHVDELDKDPEDLDLIPVVDNLHAILDSIRATCQTTAPTVVSGKLQLSAGVVSRTPAETVQSDWHLEQAKKLLIDALCHHIPRNFSNVVAVTYQIGLRPNGGLASLAPIMKEMSAKIKESTAIRRATQGLDYVHRPHQWPPHKLVVAQPLPTQFKHSLYPKLQLKPEERAFAHFLDDFCEKHGHHWLRNDVSDVKLFRGHYPDFIVFSESNYVFIEYKGKHLLDTRDSIRKNTIGQMAAAYFMVYMREEGFMQKGWAGEPDTPFQDIDLASALRTRPSFS